MERLVQGVRWRCVWDVGPRLSDFEWLGVEHQVLYVREIAITLDSKQQDAGLDIHKVENLTSAYRLTNAQHHK